MKNQNLCERPYCREPWAWWVSGYPERSRRSWSLRVCSTHAEPYQQRTGSATGIGVTVQRRASEVTDTCTKCGAPATGKRWGSIHTGACGARRRRVRDATYDAIASARKFPNPTPAAETVASLQRTFAMLERDAQEHGFDHGSVHDWPRSIISATLSIRQQLECVRGQALRLVRHEGSSYPPDAIRLVLLIDDLLMPEPPFTAPVTMELVVLLPPAVHLAILRLDEAGYIPLRADNLPTDPQLARDRRLLEFFLLMQGEK